MSLDPVLQDKARELCLQIQRWGFSAVYNDKGQVLVEPRNNDVSKMILVHVAKKYGFKFDYKVELYQKSERNLDVFTVKLVLEYEGRTPER